MNFNWSWMGIIGGALGYFWFGWAGVVIAFISAIGIASDAAIHGPCEECARQWADQNGYKFKRR